MQFSVHGKVYGADELQRMFAKSPAVLRNELLRWLMFENEKFIGTKRVDGAVRASLNRKRTWISGQGWRSQVVNLFKGYVVDPLTGKIVNFKNMNTAFGAGTGTLSSGISMVLKMGMMYRNKKQIHEAIESLEESHSVNSDKYMPIPVRGLGISKPYQKFQFWLKSGAFNVVYRNGVALYFMRESNGASGKLMFVGRKNVNVRWRHGFNAAWAARQLGVVPRGSQAVERAVDKLKAM